MKTIKYKYLLYSILLISFSCSNKGKELPNFSLTALDGKIITNQLLKGKTVVINVWATWCGTCLKELPELNALTLKYKLDTNVVFIALADESAEKVKHTLSKRNFNYMQIPNAETLTDKLKTRLVKTYPQHIVVDKNKKIIFESSNGVDNTLSVLENEIEQALK